jgi:hypothetical protein
LTDSYRPWKGSGPASFAAGEPGAPPPPWPPPGSTPPGPAGTPPPGPAAPPPSGGGTVPAPPPPEAPAASGPNEPGDADDDSFQPAPWIYLVIAALIVALLAFLFWRSRDDGDADDTSTTTVPSATIAPTVPPGTLPDGSPAPTSPTGGTGSSPVETNPDGTPATTTTGGAPVTNPDGTPVTNPDGTPVTNPGGTPVTNPDGTPVTNPDGSPVTNPDGTPTAAPPAATTVPGGSGPPTGSAGPPATSPGSSPAPVQTVPALTSAALRTAQSMATALADGDWAGVRRLSPTDTRTVAELERDYAGLDSSTIVPARETTLSSGLVDLRLGLVAHESRATGPQTSLFCVHWIVDPETATVQRLDAARLRTIGGTIPAVQVAPELAATCAGIPLR